MDVSSDRSDTPYLGLWTCMAVAFVVVWITIAVFLIVRLHPVAWLWQCDVVEPRRIKGDPSSWAFTGR